MKLFFALSACAILIALQVDLAKALASTSCKQRSWIDRATAFNSKKDSNRYATGAPILTIAVVAFQLLLGPLPAEAQDDVLRGGEIFTGNCAGCHAGGMNFVKENKNLKRAALEKFVSPSMDKDEIQQWVQNSGQHKKLVFFKAPSGNGKLTDNDYSDVISYVVDQAVGEKW